MKNPSISLLLCVSVRPQGVVGVSAGRAARITFWRRIEPVSALDALDEPIPVSFPRTFLSQASSSPPSPLFILYGGSVRADSMEPQSMNPYYYETPECSEGSNEPACAGADGSSGARACLVRELPSDPPGAQPEALLLVHEAKDILAVRLCAIPQSPPVLELYGPRIIPEGILDAPPPPHQA